jgi:predicted ATP-dependent endonuclease of OLD family
MNNDCVYIHGLGISSYRSFPKDIQQIYPFKKVNLFIGRNNSGKSNILNFLYKHYLSIFRGEEIEFENVDYHDFALLQKNEIKTEFYFYARKGWKEELINKHKSIPKNNNNSFRYKLENQPKNEILQKILESDQLSKNEDSYFCLTNHQYSIGSHFEFKNLEINDFEKIISSDKQFTTEYLEGLHSDLKQNGLEGWKNLTENSKKSEIKSIKQSFDSSRFDHPIDQEKENKRIENDNKISYLKEIFGYVCDFMLD